MASGPLAVGFHVDISKYCEIISKYTMVLYYGKFCSIGLVLIKIDNSVINVFMKERMKIYLELILTVIHI